MIYVVLHYSEHCYIWADMQYNSEVISLEYINVQNRMICPAADLLLLWRNPQCSSGRSTEIWNRPRTDLCDVRVFQVPKVGGGKWTESAVWNWAKSQIRSPGKLLFQSAKLTCLDTYWSLFHETFKPYFKLNFRTVVVVTLNAIQQVQKIILWHGWWLG